MRLHLRAIVSGHALRAPWRQSALIRRRPLSGHEMLFGNAGQYYGRWQIEQGNRESAQYHLSRIAAICGTSREGYRSLASALEQAPGTGLVY